MNELLNLKHNSVRLGLCSTYLDRWNKATSDDDLIDIALDVNGAEFLAMSVADGWGLPTEFIKERFGKFINGKWYRHKNGYTSELYAGFDGDISQRCTLTTLIDCTSTIYVPNVNVARLYVSGESNITVRNDGECDVYIYGDKAKVSRHPWSTGKYTEHIIPKQRPHLNNLIEYDFSYGK